MSNNGRKVEYFIIMWPLKKKSYMTQPAEGGDLFTNITLYVYIRREYLPLFPQLILYGVCIP